MMVVSDRGASSADTALISEFVGHCIADGWEGGFCGVRLGTSSKGSRAASVAIFAQAA